jgi:hypothetical protein
VPTKRSAYYALGIFMAHVQHLEHAVRQTRLAKALLEAFGA